MHLFLLPNFFLHLYLFILRPALLGGNCRPAFVTPNIVLIRAAYLIYRRERPGVSGVKSLFACQNIFPSTVCLLLSSNPFTNLASDKIKPLQKESFFFSSSHNFAHISQHCTPSCNSPNFFCG